ncbi:hypothetical protein [Magnetospirillum sp. UT-4]|uniref:hypothetical protein n=1 Tax=Magnetospirillum sp. UT-4 TaxID=2681467 RepID=UPI001573F500|nr:hypothetical protein [Magnetospirillum sp. UT-4]
MEAVDGDLVFFLGGRDLEMATIRDLVADTLGLAAVRDGGLGWGARLSDYAAELAGLGPGQVPVLVELALDRPLPPAAVVVDHHGPAAGRHAPTALEQVFRLLGLPPERWTRHLALVAANDRGHVRAMRAIGATADEIAAIRQADRRAQGITAAEEEDALAALARAERHLDGRLLVVRLPHDRTATVMDRIAPDDGAIANVLILCPAEVDFFGIGAAVVALDAAFPGGYCGGDLPEAGFWGHRTPTPAEDALLGVLGQVLPAAPPPSLSR